MINFVTEGLLVHKPNLKVGWTWLSGETVQEGDTFRHPYPRVCVCWREQEQKKEDTGQKILGDCQKGSGVFYVLRVGHLVGMKIVWPDQGGWIHGFWGSVVGKVIFSEASRERRKYCILGSCYHVWNKQANWIWMHTNLHYSGIPKTHSDLSNLSD